MNRPELFTIGHSNLEMPALIERLQRYEIALVADVRSSPYSSFNSQYNREPLAAALTDCGIEYKFMGRELGARREERQCYVERRARYDLIARLPLFQQGLDFLRQAAARQRIALLCAEKDPLPCHRTILVCRHLRVHLAISHILEDGSIETQDAAENRLLALLKMPSASLIQTKEELIEEAYDRQGLEIAYVESAREAEEMEYAP